MAVVAEAEVEEVTNRQVILKRYVSGCPTVDDMEVVAGAVRLAVPCRPGRRPSWSRTSTSRATPTCAPA